MNVDPVRSPPFRAPSHVVHPRLVDLLRSILTAMKSVDALLHPAHNADKSNECGAVENLTKRYLVHCICLITVIDVDDCTFRRLFRCATPLRIVSCIKFSCRASTRKPTFQ